MRCFVTAGPTWEPLDRVRRLTNFSTGTLGGELANALVLAGHDVVLLLSDTATWRQPLAAVTVEAFSTTDSLAQVLRAHSTPGPVAIFHAAAVSDFAPGAISLRRPDGGLEPVRAGKVDSQAGNLVIELRPTAKILPQLRGWFPTARLTGWKYEVDGTPTDALARGQSQLKAADSDACVVNGPAHGPGFTVLRRNGIPIAAADRAALFAALLGEL